MSVLSIILIAVSIGVLGFIVWFFTYAKKSQKKHDEKFWADKDDKLFDPQTGAVLTLEQAESGEYEADDGLLISEEALAAGFSEIDRPMAEGLNAMVRYSGMQPRLMLPEAELSFMYKAALPSNFSRFSTGTFVRLHEHDFLGYVNLTHSATGGGGISLSSAAMILHSPYFAGHYVFRPRSFSASMSKLLSVQLDEGDVPVSGFLCDTITAVPEPLRLANLLAPLADAAEIAFEVNHGTLLVMSMATLNPEEVNKFTGWYEQMGFSHQNSHA